MTVPGLKRLSDLEEQLDELRRVVIRQQQIIGALARWADPTTPQLAREDRDSIVAFAASTRGPDQPEGSSGPD